MYGRILVPLDGSHLAESVLPHVEAVATKFGAEVVLFRTVEPERSPERSEQAVQSAEQYLETLARSFQRKGLSARTLVTVGEPAPSILRAASSEQASLIALSTHGRSGLTTLLSGTVADEVMRNAHLPILLVRPTRYHVAPGTSGST